MYMYIYVYIYIYTLTYVYIYMYTYTYMHTYIYIYTRTHTYTHTYTSRNDIPKHTHITSTLSSSPPICSLASLHFFWFFLMTHFFFYSPKPMSAPMSCPPASCDMCVYANGGGTRVCQGHEPHALVCQWGEAPHKSA